MKTRTYLMSYIKSDLNEYKKYLYALIFQLVIFSLIFIFNDMYKTPPSSAELMMLLFAVMIPLYIILLISFTNKSTIQNLIYNNIQRKNIFYGFLIHSFLGALISSIISILSINVFLSKDILPPWIRFISPINLCVLLFLLGLLICLMLSFISLFFVSKPLIGVICLCFIIFIAQSFSKDILHFLMLHPVMASFDLIFLCFAFCVSTYFILAKPLI